MSHGVYAHITVSEAHRSKAIEMIRDGKIGEAADYLMSLMKEIHIGSFNGGWRFKFAVNPEFYDINDISSIREFLSRPDIVITEESYGPVSPEHFWREFEEYQQYKPDTEYGKLTKDGINYKDYPADKWY